MIEDLNLMAIEGNFFIPSFLRKIIFYNPMHTNLNIEVNEWADLVAWTRVYIFTFSSFPNIKCKKTGNKASAVLGPEDGRGGVPVRTACLITIADSLKARPSLCSATHGIRAGKS